MCKDLIDSLVKSLVAWIVFSAAVFLTRYFPNLGFGAVSIDAAADTSNLYWLLVPAALVALGFFIAGWINGTSEKRRYAVELVGQVVDLLGSASAALWSAMFFTGLHQLPLAFVFFAISVILYFISKRLVPNDSLKPAPIRGTA